ncbi:MAG: POTRA domain-containing protein [Sandaracinaceae bacterium]
MGPPLRLRTRIRLPVIRRAWCGVRNWVPFLAVALCVATPAQAQPSWDTPSPAGFREPARSGGEYEMGFFAGDTDAARGSLSGFGRLGISLNEVFDLRLTLGWGWGAANDNDAGSAANPFLAGLAVVGEERWRLRVGAGIAFPTAPATPSARQAAYLSASTRGLSELWLWVPERVSVVPMLEFQAVPVDGFYLDATLRPALIIPFDDDTPLFPLDSEGTRSDVDFALEAALGIGWRHENFLGGVRGRGLLVPTLQGDILQTSGQLFARGTGRIDDGTLELFGEARFELNLDPDLGFGSAAGPRWGLFFAIGASAGGRQIPPGRFGVEHVDIRGADQVDAQSITACLGTRERSRSSIDIGIRGTPECQEPPFDGDHLMVDLWHWPWSEWPLFDESVMERDVERIERWYRARGFYDARVVSTEVDPPAATRVDDTARRCEVGADCTVDVTFEVLEGQPVEIARMSLRGIGDLPDGMRSALRGVLPFSRGDRFDETLYENTKGRMLRVLANAGYARARVTGEVKVNRERREAFIIFVIRSGPRSVVGPVCVRGHGELPADSLFHVAGLDAGEEFSFEELRDAQRALYALGVFSAVEVASRQSDDDEEDEPDDEIDQDSDAPPEVETRRLAREAAEVTGGEAEAVCQPGPISVAEGTQAVPIDITVSPGRVERAGIGGGFQAGQVVTIGGAQNFDSGNQDAAQWDLHLSASYEHRNLFDNLIRGRLEVRPRAIFQMPFLNFTPAQDPPLGIQTTGQLQWPAFIEGRTNLTLSVRHDLGPMPFTNFFRSELGGSLGIDRTFEVFESNQIYVGAFVWGNWFLPTDRQPSDRNQQLPETGALWLQEAIRLDFRDNRQRPTEGIYIAASSQQSVQPLSSWDMIRWNAEVRGYVSPFPGLVVAGRFAMAGMHVLGFSENLSDDNVYQLTDLGPNALHLTGGGASGNRGFLPGLLGDATQIYVDEPRSDEEIARGAPPRQRPVRISGGTRLWEASLEVRVRITTNFGAVVFADAGDVARPAVGSDEEADWRFDHPQFAFGLGLRYLTIIGPLRLDIAFRPDELQVLGQEGRLPPTCQNARASGCNPRNNLDLGFARIPGTYHLTIGESF